MDKEYKYTKKLLKIAIEENGYRNKDIAVKARLSEKSVAQVSKWRNGKANATKVQMEYFINNYEYLLKPKIEHLFYTYTRSQVNDDKKQPQYKKITGEVIFKYQIATVLDRKNKLAVARLIIISHNNKYNVIEQIRAGLLLPSEESYNDRGIRLTRSINEEANWVLSENIKGNLNLDEAITVVNEYCKKLIDREINLNKYEFINIAQQDINALQFSFYQKLMKLNLHSELLPF